MALTIDIDSKNMKDMPHETHETMMTDTEIETRKDMTDNSSQQDTSRTKIKRQVAENTRLFMQ